MTVTKRTVIDYQTLLKTVCRALTGASPKPRVWRSLLWTKGILVNEPACRPALADAACG